jgi:hypothetical protein
MKTFITIFVSIFLLYSSSTYAQNGIKIKTTGKSALEVSYTSKKVTTAIITITNEAGMVITKQTSAVKKGANKILIADAAKLSEGTFLVSMVCNGKTETTKFINFKESNTL